MPRERRPTDDDLAAKLRDAGLRKTQPRIAVLRHMLSAGKPVTHAEVADALDRRGLDRVSVYRVLVDLARVGILSRSDAGDHVWRFSLQREGRSHYAEHPHFVCVTCGSVACLPDGTVRLATARRGPRALRTRKVEVQLKGECDACASSS